MVGRVEGLYGRASDNGIRWGPQRGVEIDLEQVVLGDRLQEQFVGVREINKDTGSQRVGLDPLDAVPVRQPLGDPIEERRVPPFLWNPYPQPPRGEMTDPGRRQARHSARRPPWLIGCAAARLRSRSPLRYRRRPRSAPRRIRRAPPPSCRWQIR